MSATDNDFMEGLETSNQLSGSSAGLSSQHANAHTGDTAAEQDSWLLSDDMLVSAFNSLSLKPENQTDSDEEFYLRLPPHKLSRWLDAEYTARGKSLFFSDQWVGLDLQTISPLPDQECFASKVRRVWSPVSKDMVSAQTPWSDKAAVRLTFLLIPVFNSNGRVRPICPPANIREKTQAMCIRIQAEAGTAWPDNEDGLSGWSTHWKSNTKTDVLDASTIKLSPVEQGRAFVSGVRVKRFDQRSDDPDQPHPTPFSAWIGADKEQARQKALDNETKPDLNVGFTSGLLTRYQPVVYH